MRPRTALALIALATLPSPVLAKPGGDRFADKTMAHYDLAHSGWNSKESLLTPEAVKGGRFGQIWSSPQLDGFDGVPPRLFASPLSMHAVKITAGEFRGKTFPTAFVVTTTGYAYAISTAAVGKVKPGTILWRTRLTDAPCNKGMMGNLATPVIDPGKQLLYVTSCTGRPGPAMWSAHAIALGSGAQAPGWPVEVSKAVMEDPALNRNGSRSWKTGPGYRSLQRGALNLSPDGKRLYLAFGADAVGWMVVVDLERKAVASAFSATPNDEQDGGGMWASGGPPVDAQGRIYVTTGSNLQNGLKLGLEGIYALSDHSWAHSILQFEDDRAKGLTLTGTYTPYNYCQAAKADIDIGSSAAIVLDVPPETTATPHLLVMGGGKQGNIYLLDREHMPGSLTRRQPCTIDPADDRSLLAPEVQPEWKRRGPISLFKPFSDEIGSFDQAKSRTTASYYRDSAGRVWIYVSGSSKKGENFNTSTPPGLARVMLVTAPGAPAYLKVDKLETTQTFHNPSSPIVSSNGGRDAIVWLYDQNAPRTASLYGPAAPKPLLYAFDADSLELLWKSEPGALFTTGNYGEPTIVNGLVLVGTDRLQAFGIQQP